MKKKLGIFFAFAFVAFIYVFSLLGGTLSVRDAIVLCVRELVPSLFCSIAFSLYLVRSGLWSYLGHGAVLLTGLLCGFPTGAIAAADLYASGRLSKKQTERASFLYSLPSPAFVIAYVGGSVYGSALCGAMLYIILIMSLLICDMIFYPDVETIAQKKAHSRLVSSLVSAVGEAGEKCLSVCSVVIFFYVTGSALDALGVICGVPRAIVLSLLEMTRAVKAIASLPPESAFILTAAALAFSGVSVGAQVGLYITECGLSMHGYFEKRVLLAAFASLLASALVYAPAPVFAVLCAAVLLCFALKRKHLYKGGKDKKDTEDAAYERIAHISADKAENKA